MVFVFAVLPGLIAVLVMKFMYDRSISTKEFIIHFGVSILSALVFVGITYASLYSNMMDTEILNGEVTGKYKDTVTCTQSSSCKHYYLKEKCTKYTDSNGKRKKSCTSKKVFDYPYEVDWYVKTNVGGEHEIERVNRQGTVEPKRYTITKVGDPASDTHTYMNYLLGSEDSLFYAKKLKDDTPAELVKQLPKYPKIYDYYKINHFINLTPLPTPDYNTYLSEVLKSMGAAKQVNIVIVQYDWTNTAIPDATIANWRGGKKNDVLMFFGVDKDGNIKHFQSTSFGKGMKNELLHAQLRMDMLGATMSMDTVKHSVDLVNDKFNRLPNEEFKYLIYKLQPSTGAMLLASVLSLIVSIAFGVYLRRVDL